MNIATLKEIIKDLPDGMHVFLDERVTEFTLGLVNSAKVKPVDLLVEPDAKVFATENCLVLSEE